MRRRAPIDDATFCITYYKRIGCLRRCIESIENTYGEVRVLVQDTGGNLSRARNQLVDRCETPFYIMLEEDMTLLPPGRRGGPVTDLEHMMWILLRSKRYAGVSGGLLDQNGLVYKGFNFGTPKNGVVPIRKSSILRAGSSVLECDCVPNWGVFRTEALREARWDERLELAEHEEFFFRLKCLGWRVALSRCGVGHYKVRRSQAYHRARQRTGDFRRLCKWRFVGPTTNQAFRWAERKYKMRRRRR